MIFFLRGRPSALFTYHASLIAVSFAARLGLAVIAVDGNRHGDSALRHSLQGRGELFLGLRGQAKTRILRALTTLLDPQMPYLAGCEIHDNPYSPICRRCWA